MERLTKRSNKTVHENGVCCTHFRGKECSERMGECTDNCPWEEAVWSKLADYEDAEEQGLLLRLPYPLGTEHIYYADEKDMDVYKLDAEKIEVHMMPISKKVMYTIDCFEFFIEDFGKIVFLTEKEAESALAEKGAENERDTF